MSVLSTTTYTATLDDGTVLTGKYRNGKLWLSRAGVDKRQMPVILSPADAEQLGIMLCKFLKSERDERR